MIKILFCNDNKIMFQRNNEIIEPTEVLDGIIDQEFKVRLKEEEEPVRTNGTWKYCRFLDYYIKEESECE